MPHRPLRALVDLAQTAREKADRQNRQQWNADQQRQSPVPGLSLGSRNRGRLVELNLLRIPERLVGIERLALALERQLLVETAIDLALVRQRAVGVLGHQDLARTCRSFHS